MARICLPLCRCLMSASRLIHASLQSSLCESCECVWLSTACSIGTTALISWALICGCSAWCSLQHSYMWYHWKRETIGTLSLTESSFYQLIDSLEYISRQCAVRCDVLSLKMRIKCWFILVFSRYIEMWTTSVNFASGAGWFVYWRKVDRS